MISELVEVFRGDSDRKGNAVKASVDTVEVVFDWGGWDRRRVMADSAESGSQVFVRAGSGVRARDRLQRSSGERWAVVGPAMWGGGFEVFGDVWEVFEVESLNA